jgi:hypothetical protein
MRYRVLLLTGAFLTIFHIACRKEKSLETVPLPPSTCQYAPYTAGSTFSYLYVGSNNDSSTYTLRVSGDTVLEGHTYSILTDEMTNQYIRCDTGNYFLYEPAISVPDYEVRAGARLYLRDYFPVGATWNDTVTVTLSGVEQKGLLIYKVEARDSTRTVLGKTYRDIMRVRQDAAILVNGVPYPAGNIATYYYSPGVGHVEMIAPTYTIQLINHTVR